MTTYTLFSGLTAIQAAPTTSQGGTVGSNLPSGSQLAFPNGGAGGPVTPPTNQTFQLVVVGAGSVSASAQPVVSNDGINWVNYGSAISASSATTVSVGSGTGAAVWAYYAAYLTAISGTGAKATMTMNA